LNGAYSFPFYEPTAVYRICFDRQIHIRYAVFAETPVGKVTYLNGKVQVLRQDAPQALVLNDWVAPIRVAPKGLP